MASYKYPHRGQARRFREVTNILARHGFGFIFGRLSFRRWTGRFRSPVDEDKVLLSAPQRLRLALEELGPTYIKLGQLLSTRPDIVPRDYIRELERLQDDVPPISFTEVLRVLEEEGIDRSAFAELEETPLAAASIGQVHRARLVNGEQVVVKVQRPGIRQVVETDLHILFHLASLVEKRTSWGKLYQARAIIEEFAAALLRELDFAVEGQNAAAFYRNFRRQSNVIIPRVYWPYTTSRVLTLEYVPGIKVSDYAALRESGYDLKKVAYNLVDSLFKQYYEHGFFHADPHPGNIAIAPGTRVVYYDFGQVGVIDETLKERCMDLVMAMVRYDVNAVTRALLQLGIATSHVNPEELRRDVARLQQKYYGVPMSQIKLGEALAELVELSFKHQVRIPPELSLVVKMMMTIEGLIAELDPDLSIVEIAEPFSRRIIMHRYAPSQLKNAARDTLFDYTHLFRYLPRYTDSILSQLEEGEFKLRLEHSNLRRLLNIFDIVANRISLAIITASIIIGTSLMVREGYNARIYGLSVVEIGFFSALILGIFLIYSIIRSGRY